jgi:hypothetical protein
MDAADKSWLRRQGFGASVHPADLAHVTEQDRANARWLLGNLRHYMGGRSEYDSDVEKVAKALAAACESDHGEWSDSPVGPD